MNVPAGSAEARPAQRPAVSLREIVASDRKGLDVIADLHMELLDYGPMAGLGREFVRDICYRVHMEEGVLRVLLAEVDGEPAGFVAVTPYSLSFHRSGLGGHAVRAAWALLLAIAARPVRLIRLLRALRVLASRRGERHPGIDPLGEVVCIAVRPQYLQPRFVRSTGIRTSEMLVRRSAEYLRRAGVDLMRMLVDADNRPVLLLYHLLGARFNDYQLGGEPMVEVWFDLTDGKLAPECPVPAAWAFESPRPGAGTPRLHVAPIASNEPQAVKTAEVPSAKDDWRSYWEGIADRQDVFRAEARDHIARLRRLVPIDSHTHALDFGCGFGFAAEQLAPHVGRVDVWDGAENVRRRARIRLAHVPNIGLVNLADPDRDAPERAYDLITVHSVIQYMSRDEIASWLRRWRRMLKPDGRLVLSDLIQPGMSGAVELVRYLAFAARSGFFWNALLEGGREFARYARARRSRPLTSMTVAQLSELAGEAGFTVEPLPENLSYRAGRVTAALRPVAV